MKGRLVVVTGAGRGIGKAIAMECARAGARVTLTARTESEIEEAASEIEKETGSEARAFPLDVGDTDAVLRTFARIEKEAGPVDGLVCAAGIYGPIGELSPESLPKWEECLRINVMGSVAAAAAVLPGMKERKRGRVVFFSGGGQGAMPRFSAYVSSKGAITRLTETLAAECAPHGVYVNAIAPGAVNTRFLDELLEAGPEKAGKELYERSLKQKREGGQSPQKAADLVRFLLSDPSRGLYGKTLSAVWDDYASMKDLEAISKSDLYAFRRVVHPGGGTRA